jgi:hypothetical protein
MTRDDLHEAGGSRELFQTKLKVASDSMPNRMGYATVSSKRAHQPLPQELRALVCARAYQLATFSPGSQVDVSTERDIDAPVVHWRWACWKVCG